MAQENRKRLKTHWNVEAYWEDMEEFLELFRQNGSAINYTTFTGHGALRSAVMGQSDRPPTSKEMEKMKALLSESMELGSLGLSSGLEYAPGCFANSEELVQLCQVVADLNGTYATHMRNEDFQVEEAVAETIDVCRKTGVRLQISHLKTLGTANWGKMDNILETISHAGDLEIGIDRYPYLAGCTDLTIFLPPWSKEGGTEELINRLNSSSMF